MRHSDPGRDPRPLLAVEDPDAVLDAVTVTRPDGTIVAVNHGFTRLHGYRPSDVVGANPRVLSSGLHATSTYTSLWETVRGGNVWVGELVDRTADGELRGIRSVVTPIADGQGRIVRFVALQRELGPLLADEAHRSAGTLRVDDAGRCLASDPRAAARLQADPQELFGHAWLRRLDRFDAEAVLDTLGLAIGSGRRMNLAVIDPRGDALRLRIEPTVLGGGSWVGATLLLDPHDATLTGPGRLSVVP